ncbi:NAD(P)/FAD-dependent oxidoreductase [Algirhabdus cladophorae]|uniref:NAD(P)/FAD-dependent oxidoreductase n=1 Tax=Algirhabdus cladophorae TaxID=3377108 RepID=UPI003B8483E1
MSAPIVVIGAGIVGVSTAIWLQRAGHRVVLLDKDAPGQAASFGNAGLLAGWAITPVTSPRLWRDAPPMILNPRSPLFIKWRQLPRLLPWFARFLRHTSDAETRRIVAAMDPLISDSVDQHRQLAAGTRAEGWIENSKMGFVYNRKRDFKNDAYMWALKAEYGLSPDVLEGPALRDAEPILSPQIEVMAVLSGWGHVTNPGGYITALADAFVAQGGQVVQAEVTAIHRADGTVREVITDQGPMPCKKLVVTAGAWSREMMQMLGLDVPLIAERGYHVLLEEPSMLPRHPMLMMNGKFGVNPMEMGLRCAGTVEYGDTSQTPSRKPLALLRRHIAQSFPKLTYKSTQDWMGFRPSTPDSLPLIGQIGTSGIYTGFGHQHVGLTAGPKTGRLVAQMIDEQPANQDMSGFDPARYLR